MTREEAKTFLCSIAGDLGFIDVEKYTCQDGERMREAIKALEQQPEDIANGIPFPKICDKDNSEIIKDLSKRVEALEKQMEEDKAEQLKKLNAELDYAKFRCTL